MLRTTPLSSAPARIAAAVALSLGIAGTSFADSSHQPAITEAHVAGNVLHIAGLYFGSAKPKVTLGTLPLSVIAATASGIDAVLPSTVAPGSYLLTVTLAKGRNDDRNDDGKYDEFWVTIGAGGAAGKEGAQGPQGPAGTGGSLSTIDSIAGLPCTVAMCAGTTAITFDPSTSLARLSCVRAPGANTLRIQGSAAIGPLLVKDTLRYTSDVPGFSGDIVTRDAQHNYVGFDIPAGNLCSGQRVSLTVIRSGVNYAALTVQGGSCTPARTLQSLGGGDYSATCSFTMNGDQVLTIQ